MTTLDVLKHDDLPGIEIYLVNITPKIADEFLDVNTEGQRNLNGDVVERYIDDMSSNNWMFSGAPILFDKQGKLIDGQHRLNAIVDSQTTQLCLVVAGLDPDVMKAVDLGRKRTYASFLAMNLDRPNAGAQASIIRAAWHWDEAEAYGDRGTSRIPVPSALIHSTPTIAQMEATRKAIEAELGITFTAAAQQAQRAYQQLPKITNTVWGLAYVLMTRFNVDLREGFFNELLFEPQSPAADYPINTLRNRLGRVTGRLKRTEQIHLVFKTFNFWREGKLTQTMAMPNLASWHTLAMPPTKEENK